MKRKTKKWLIAGGILLLAACLFVPHICSVDIVWDGFSSVKEMNIPAKLPKGAVKVPEGINPIVGAGVLAAALIAALIVVVRLMRKAAHAVYRTYRILGLACSFFSMPLHELLHAWACPAGSEVHLGIVPEKLLSYAATNVPMNTAQFTAYMALPAVVIGILPLIAAMMTYKRNQKAGSFLLFYGVCGLIQSAPDWFNLIPVLRNAPPDAVIQISNGITYWFTR